MSSVVIQQLLAASDLQVDAPGWAPLVFAAGAFAVVLVVLVLMWKKLKQSEQWRSDDDPQDDHDQN